MIPGPVQPTRDLSCAKEDLARWGYCVLAEALPSAQLQALQQRVKEQMEAECRRGLGYAYGEVIEQHEEQDSLGAAPGERASAQNRWISMLINKGQVFLDLLEHAAAAELLGKFLGEGYLLSSYAVHITNPGVRSQALLHTDQWWMPRAYARNTPHRPVGDVPRAEFHTDTGGVEKPISPPVVANILWMLSDFNEENGGTRLVPGSHLSGEEPDPGTAYSAQSIAVTGPPGTAVMFDGRIWHGVGINRGGGVRVGLFSTYCGGMFRQLENYTLGTAPEILAKASPRLLALLGFKPWQGYGRVGGNSTDLASFERDYVGKLQD